MEKLGSLKPLYLFWDQVVCENLLFNQRTALKLHSNLDNAALILDRLAAPRLPGENTKNSITHM